MMKKLYLLYLAALFIPVSLTGQITTEPQLPVANQKVTITFNSSQESRLGLYTGELYAHTGVIVEGSNDWNYVIGSWGNNTQQPKLTHTGNGIYTLEITPDINSFYKVAQGEKVLRMAFVFRTANGQSQTNDLFVQVYEEGLIVQLTEPAAGSIVRMNQELTISAQASEEAELKLYLGSDLLEETTGTSITAGHTFTEAGSYMLVAEAIAGSETVADTIFIMVREETTEEAIPESWRKGINYPSDTSAALVLFAPFKEFVFVLGDFNNWQPENNYQMKKDGDHFWLEITGLESGMEYAFQYLIDGDIRIADPYTEKILDPWNDQYISDETYPGLISYPEGLAEGIVSILHPGQEEYQWEITDFQVPETEKLVIYELLIRDFTEEHTFSAVLEKLDYLEDLNINVLELMPVNEFEGNSSWGYNPSFYFAPDKYYGPRNELKKLVDECHKRGIAVVIDMVLNHSYGQSPLVLMYMDNWVITDENPWYNVQSNFQNTSLTWGFDFNHDAEVTRELVDSINSFWINEYKIDGFRFDFTKGFSNTPYEPSSWGSEYDASRIANLKRMADEIRNRKEDALIIFEHLSENFEEKELADYGILMWGNMHGSYREAARGNAGNSDLSWGVYTSRNWNEPNLITYAESHDEERIMVDLLNSGFIEGSYNIRQLPTALKRMELISVFHLPLPGPKMIWQFGERGYDVSINDLGGRLSEKPPRWEYLQDSDRTDLFTVMAQLNHLKQTYEEFATDDFDFSLSGQTRWYRLSTDAHHVFGLGNFGITGNSTDVTFPATGKWYEFFSGDSIDISQASQNFNMSAGEYRLYSTRKLAKTQVVTDVPDVLTEGPHLVVYPNPATGEITVSTGRPIEEIRIIGLTGKVIYQSVGIKENQIKIPVSHLIPGIYLIQLNDGRERVTQKFIKK